MASLDSRYVEKQIPELAGLKVRTTKKEIRRRFTVEKQIPELAGLKVSPKKEITMITAHSVEKQIPELAGLKAFKIS